MIPGAQATATAAAGAGTSMLAPIGGTESTSAAVLTALACEALGVPVSVCCSAGTARSPIMAALNAFTAARRPCTADALRVDRL